MDRAIENKYWIKRKYWKYIIGGLIVLILILVVIFQNYESTYKVDKEKLTIEKVFQGPFQDYINIVGKVEPVSIVQIEVKEAGTVEDILLDEGAIVKSGDIILRLRNEDLNMSFLDEASSFAYLTNEMNNRLIQLDQQQLADKQEFLDLQNNLNDKQRLYEKTESLHKLGGVSDEEFITIRNSYEIALQNRDLMIEQMKLDSVMRNNNRTYLKLQIRLVRQRLENLKVKAPVDGQLSLDDIELGQTMSKGSRIGQISVLSSYKIAAEIDEHYIDRIEKGLSASFERQQDTFYLVLSKVYPKVINSVFKVDLKFQGPLPQNIRMGQSYYIDIQMGETQEAVQLARGGFFQSTGGQWVYVLDPEGTTASKREIRIGRQNPKYYEVISGLQPTDEVIISGYDLFGDNDKLILR